jgi:hypothetical protein
LYYRTNRGAKVGKSEEGRLKIEERKMKREMGRLKREKSIGTKCKL